MNAVYYDLYINKVAAVDFCNQYGGSDGFWGKNVKKKGIGMQSQRD